MIQVPNQFVSPRHSLIQFGINSFISQSENGYDYLRAAGGFLGVELEMTFNLRGVDTFYDTSPRVSPVAIHTLTLQG